MITRKSSALSVCLEKQNLSEMFPPSLALFQSYLFVRAYQGVKDKPVNIVRIVVNQQGSIYWGGRGKLPPKSFPEKKLKLFQLKIFLDGDFQDSGY